MCTFFLSLQTKYQTSHESFCINCFRQLQILRWHSPLFFRAGVGTYFFACEEPRSRWSHGRTSQLLTILPDSHKNLLQNQPPESVSRARSGRSELSCPCHCQLLEAAREDREGHSGGIAKYVVPVKLDRVKSTCSGGLGAKFNLRPVHQKNLVLLRHQGRVETC